MNVAKQLLGIERVPNIGDWVRREPGGSKWHFVESIVADAAFTRCGRRMAFSTTRNEVLDVSEVMPLTRMIGQPQLCKAGCDV